MNRKFESKINLVTMTRFIKQPITSLLNQFLTVHFGFPDMKFMFLFSHSGQLSIKTREWRLKYEQKAIFLTHSENNSQVEVPDQMSGTAVVREEKVQCDSAYSQYEGGGVVAWTSLIVS